MVQQFRKKPVVIEAIQFTERSVMQMYKFINGENSVVIKNDIDAGKWEDYERSIIKNGYSFKTLESDGETQKAILGDWIIKGVNGEFYPCKPDVFDKTYDQVINVEQKPNDFEIKPKALESSSDVEKIYLWDTINGDDHLEEFDTIEECEKYVKECFTDTLDGVHPDIESLNIYKKVGGVYVEETGNYCTHNKEEVPIVKVKVLFDNGYKAKQSSAIVWVKASERLPEDDSVKHIRHKLGDGFWIPDTGYYRKAKHWFECDRGRQIFEIDKIEWLDESNTSAIVESEERDLLEQLRKDLEDKRITKLMAEFDANNRADLEEDANIHPLIAEKMQPFTDMYYLSLKHTAEFLLDKYEIKEQTKEVSANHNGHTSPYNECKICNPEVENDNEPEVRNTNEASVASHSCTVGNSIEHNVVSSKNSSIGDNIWFDDDGNKRCKCCAQIL